MPEVSIILPVFNAENTLHRAINSVLSQSFQDWELICVDDGSSDSSAEILDKFVSRDERIKVQKSKHNKGPAKARNSALDSAAGKYIAFLDADDFWQPKKLKIQISEMKKLEIEFSFTPYENVARDGTRKTFPVVQKVDQSTLLGNTVIGCSTVVLSKKLVGSARFSDAPIEDLELWFRLLKGGGYAHCIANEPLTVRFQGDRSHNKLLAARGNWRTIRDYTSYPFYKKSIFFISYVVQAIKKYN